METDKIWYSVHNDDNSVKKHSFFSMKTYQNCFPKTFFMSE